MKIYIPTRGRAASQITFNNLPKVLQDDVTLVIDYSERNDRTYMHYPDILICPIHINNIGKVRQYICDTHVVSRFGPSLLMMDDDLRFYKRRTDQPDKFKDITDRDMLEFMSRLEKIMEKYAHAGMLAREGGNRIIEPYKECTRLLRVLAYNVEVMRANNVGFDRLAVMEDFDAALQLLRAGYKNVALCKWVHNQVGSGAAGGCSTYRTLEAQAKGARGLHERHKDFVKVVEKTTKTAWGGATRTDVVVQWAKAYASSQRSER